MSVTDYESFIQYIKTKQLKCAYLLVVLFSAIKLRDAEGTFPKERLVDFFIEFYKIREKYKLVLNKECNPLQSGDRNATIQLINEKPLNTLIENGILETPERFKTTINKVIFEKEHEILLTIKTKFIVFYHDALKDRNLTLNLFPDDMGLAFISDLIGECFSEWQLYINDIIKSDASKKLAAAVDKINIQDLLKYLFQSYSLKTMNQLLAQFHMTEEELNDYFNGDFDYSKLPILEQIQAPVRAPSPTVSEQPGKAIGAQFTDTKQIHESIKTSEHKVQALTDLFQQMKETDVEEDFYEAKQKALEESRRILEGKPEKKKKRFGKFKKLFKKKPENPT